MSNDLLPESIRGGWYVVDPEAEDDESSDLVFFRLDESFERLDPDGEEEDAGDYTFDGQFLILRGRRTETFRVHPETPWRWRLEGKRQERLLMRGRAEHGSALELEGERREEIERLPMRVFVRSRFEEPERGRMADLVHEPRSGEALLIGHLCTEPVREGRLWLALTPLTSSLEADTWAEVVRQSYLGVYLDDTDSIEQVEVRITDDGEQRTFRHRGD